MDDTIVVPRFEMLRNIEWDAPWASPTSKIPVPPHALTSFVCASRPGRTRSRTTLSCGDFWYGLA